MVMEWMSYCHHSELYWGPVREDQRCRIQSVLARSVCRECQLPVHPVSGGSPAAGATLLWWFWRGTKSWWSMHRCPEGRCRIRVYETYEYFALRCFVRKLTTLLTRKQRGSSDESAETGDLTVHILSWPCCLHIWHILDLFSPNLHWLFMYYV